MAGPERHTPPSVGSAQDRAPTVVASDVSITYRIFGTGRAVEDDDEMGVLKRVFQRSTQNVGIREVPAVKHVSFVTHQGESVGLVGRNGSGKSTLLRSVAGLVPPTEGRLWLRGKAALLGVNAVLLPNLSGRHNIWIGAQALGLTPKEVRARFDGIVEFADLGEFIDLPMKSYSSGMAARLRFAISTAVVPDILVVDEALATGDAQFRERAQQRIAEIRGEAGTVFMVSHNPSTITKLCDRALWLDAGELVMDGPAREVVDAYTARYAKKNAKTSAKDRPAPPGQKQQ